MSTMQLNIHEIENVEIENKYFPPDNSSNAFDVTKIKIKDVHGTEYTIQLFSEPGKLRHLQASPRHD